MNGAQKTFRELGSKKGDLLDRFTRLQRAVMPLSKRTRRSAKIERFKTYDDLLHGRPDTTAGTK